jgi:sugar-specific transcriptional regulator TrmB
MKTNYDTIINVYILIKNLMSHLSDNLTKSLELFGLDRDEAVVYLELLKEDSLTALKLSRNLKIARTKIYRVLEKLLSKGFLKEEIRDYGTKFIAEPYEKLNLIISSKEEQLNTLKQNAPALFNQLAIISMSNGAEESKILHYRGVEGLKQVTWNSTKVKGDLRIYEVNLMHYLIDREFSEKVRREFAKDLSHKFFQLTNHIHFDEYTQLENHIKQWNLRHVPKEELDIKFEIQIYNNVTCMYEYTNDDIFIVEIYNKSLADMQKQIFDFVWKYAKPMKIMGLKGRAELK